MCYRIECKDSVLDLLPRCPAALLTEDFGLELHHLGGRRLFRALHSALRCARCELESFDLLGFLRRFCLRLLLRFGLRVFFGLLVWFSLCVFGIFWLSFGLRLRVCLKRKTTAELR